MNEQINNNISEQERLIAQNYREIPAGMVNPITFIDKNDEAEKRTYLVLYICTDDEGNEIKSYEFCIGRTETFNFIKNMIEYIDINESKVLSENNTLKNIVSVYEFMKYLRDNDLIYDKSFDIDEYYNGDVEE